MRICIARCFSTRGLHRRVCVPMSAQTVIQMTRPKPGDRILVVRPHWIRLILSGEKTLEIRARNLSPGKYWLGNRGIIYGCLKLGPGTLIDSVGAWIRLRQRHCVEAHQLPYNKTYGLPIQNARRVRRVSYTHPRGAIGLVRFA